jgi:hypothetical protein
MVMKPSRLERQQRLFAGTSKRANAIPALRRAEERESGSTVVMVMCDMLSANGVEKDGAPSKIHRARSTNCASQRYGEESSTTQTDA